MTELLCQPVVVRRDPAGEIRAVQVDGRWHRVVRTTTRWVVETDWWRRPVRREYFRCLTADGECLDLARDLETGSWSLVRRYD